MSFKTLGIFWIGQLTQLKHLERSERSLTWIRLGFLFAVTLMPFTTRLLGEFHTLRTALIVYWLNIVLLGVGVYVSWVCALQTGLVKPDLAPGFPKATQRRIVVAQTLYALGAALCVFSYTLEYRIHRCGAAELRSRALGHGAGVAPNRRIRRSQATAAKRRRSNALAILTGPGRGPRMVQ